MIDETNAANSGGDQPGSLERSVWMKSNPYSGWPLFSIRPYMCTPHSLQACRWIVALGSTTESLLPFALTLRLSRPTTATCENRPFCFLALAPAAHLVVRGRSLDRYLDLVLRAIAYQRPACKAVCRGPQ